MPSKDLVFRFLGVDAGAGREFDRMAGKTKVLQSSFDRLTVGAAAMGVGVVAAAVKMAGDFQQQTNVLVTAAGESQKNLAKVRAGIKAIAAETGTSWQQEAAAAYQAEKAHYRGADALKVVRAASQGAREENANLATTVAGMTSIMASYNIKADRSVQVMNALKTGAGEAKTTFELYVGALSSVLPVASAAKIGLDQVLGSLSTLTQHGTSPDQGAVDLADLIRHLQAPTQLSIKAMQQLGLNVTDVQQNLGKRGLTGTLELFTEVIAKHMGPQGLVFVKAMNQSKSAAADANEMIKHMPANVAALAKEYQKGQITLAVWREDVKKLPADQAPLAQQFASLEARAQGFNSLLRSGSPVAQTYTQALRTMVGDSTGLNVALMLTRANMPGLLTRVDAVGKSFRDRSKDVEGWATTSKNFNVVMGGLEQTLSNAGIDLGSKLLPPLTEFGRFLETHQKVVEGFATVVGVGLTANLVKLAGRATISPLLQLFGVMKDVSKGELGAAFSAKPIPVYVTNWKGGGGLPSLPGGGQNAEGEAKTLGQRAKQAAKDITQYGPSAYAAARWIGKGGRILDLAALTDPVALASMFAGSDTNKGAEQVTAVITSLLKQFTIRNGSVYAKNGAPIPNGVAADLVRAGLLPHDPNSHLANTSPYFVNYGSYGSGAPDKKPGLTEIRLLAQALNDATTAGIKYKNAILPLAPAEAAAARATATHTESVQRQWNKLALAPHYFGLAEAASQAGGRIIGTNIAVGMTQGIDNGFKMHVLRAVTRMADGSIKVVSTKFELASPSKLMRRYGNWIAEGLALGIADGEAKTYLAAQTVATRLATKLKTDTAKLKADLSARNSLAASIASGWEGYADISGAYDTTANIPTDLSAYLSGRLNTVNGLNTDLSKLGKMGLSGALIKQLASMSPDQGLQFANSILAGNGGGVGHLNALWSQIAKATNQASMTAANAVMGHQIAADKRAVAHAEHQREQMIALLSIIARKVGANPSAKEIRQELLVLKRQLGGSLGLA